MITEKTVFILGAGASCPYGFPSGAQLRKNICLEFPDKYEKFLTRTHSLDEFRLEGFKSFSKKFFDSGTKSIDLFLSRRSELANIGKYVIAFEILSSEINSSFNEKSKNEGKEDWLFYLFDRMTNTIKDKTQIKKFAENNISFITFNYDRSLEHFFFTSLRNSFGIPQYEIFNILKQLKIFHVYGSLAPLDWQDDREGVKYGKKPEEWVLQHISQNLRTIYEETQNPELEEAKKLIAEAQKVFFLGFGYADENMEILGLPNIICPSCDIYGTALGLSDKQKTDTANKICKGIKSNPETSDCYDGRKIKLEEVNCLELLGNYL